MNRNNWINGECVKHEIPEATNPCAEIPMLRPAENLVITGGQIGSMWGSDIYVSDQVLEAEVQDRLNRASTRTLSQVARDLVNPRRPWINSDVARRLSRDHGE